MVFQEGSDLLSFITLGKMFNGAGAKIGELCVSFLF